MTKIATYAEFWPYYLAEHSHPGTRGLHYFGTSLGLVLLAAAAVLADWRFVLASVVSGYAFAWIGHMTIERNRPATFTYPVWSLASDFRMFGLWLTGRLGGELERHQIGASGAPRPST